MNYPRMLRALHTPAVIAIGLMAASIAHAQVAAPSLVPFTFVTENPAAMQWGAPSRVGLAYAQAQAVTDPKSLNDNFDGYLGGLRLVGSRFSFAGEGSHFESSNKPYSVNEGEDTARGALAVRLGDIFSFGIGQQHSELKLWSPNLSNLLQTTYDQTHGGFTFRFGEWFFLGAGGGQESVSGKNLTTTLGSFSTSRDVYKYGVGIRTGGTILTHFEYYVVDKTKFANSTLNGGHETDRTAVAELNLGGFLLAYSTTHYEFDTSSADTDTADIGYAPYTGLTIVLHGEVTKGKDPTATLYPSTTTTRTGLAITYLFGG